MIYSNINDILRKNKGWQCLLIYTVTLNPSLDYVVKLDKFNIGEVNRSKEEQIFPGGKGINVSLVLSKLGEMSRCLGFAAGFTGKEIIHRLETEGCETDFIILPKGFSRINVKLKGHEESEINGGGPEIQTKELEALFSKLEHLKDDDILIFAGSIPSLVPQNIYEILIERLSNKKLKIVVDASGEALRRVLQLKPFLVKPNHHELGELFGKTLTSTDEIIEAAVSLQQIGARNVLVSRAADGAILLDESGKIYIANAPKGKVVNSVGAGDSMIAGFLAGYQKYGNYNEALKLGIAAGSASAFSPWLGSSDMIWDMYKTL